VRASIYFPRAIGILVDEVAPVLGQIVVCDWTPPIIFKSC